MENSERQIVLQEIVQPNAQPQTTSESEISLGDFLTKIQTSPTQVNTYHALLPLLTTCFENKVNTFQEGNLSAYSIEWQALTSDPEIL